MSSVWKNVSSRYFSSVLNFTLHTDKWSWSLVNSPQLYMDMQGFIAPWQFISSPRKVSQWWLCVFDHGFASCHNTINGSHKQVFSQVATTMHGSHKWLFSLAATHKPEFSLVNTGVFTSRYNATNSSHKLVFSLVNTMRWTAHTNGCFHYSIQRDERLTQTGVFTSQYNTTNSSHKWVFSLVNTTWRTAHTNGCFH